MYTLILLLSVLQLSAPIGASESGIIGGTIVQRHSRPYMASLQNKGHLCGGMLIRRDFVLTSGHCSGNNPLLVVLGARNISKEERNQQKIPVAHYYRHPIHRTFNPIQYDMMLLKLKKAATLTRYVKVIHLPKKNEEVPVNSQCSVAGWGMTRPNSKASDVLREANVKMENTRTCKKKWQKYFHIKQMLCTRTDDGKGICQGDSGGPLVCKEKAFGVVAYTYPSDCANPIYPNVYMKISFFIPWIEEVLSGAVSPSYSV